MILRSHVYRIRNAAGLYSTGGDFPRFVEVNHAKSWTSIGAVKNHLNRHPWDCVGGIPSDWTVLRIAIVERIESEQPATELEQS